MKGTQKEYILIATVPVRHFPELGVFGYGTPLVWAVYVDDKDGPKTLNLYDGESWYNEELRLGELMGYAKVIDNITVKTLAYRGITEEAVTEPQPWRGALCATQHCCRRRHTDTAYRDM